MELTASGVRFLLSPAAMDALVNLLELPPFHEGKAAGPAEQEAGIAWLMENGYLTPGTGDKPVLSRELAFMIAGLCVEKNALVWQEKGNVSMIACCFRGIYLLCWRMRIGKWAITPYAGEASFQQELEERLSLMTKAQLIHRAQMTILPEGMTGAECIQLLHQNKEA